MWRFYSSKRSILFLTVLSAFVLVSVGALIYFKFINQPSKITPISTEPKKQTEADALRKAVGGGIFKVGKDSYNRVDIDNVAKGLFQDKPLQTLSATEEAQLAAVIKEKSITLQEAKKQGLVQFDDKILSSNKDFNSYEKAVDNARQAVIDQSAKISVKGIMLFFNNTVPPKMGTEAAKQLTHTKMQKYHDDLVAGKTTIEKAAQSIIKDTSLQDVDVIYDLNAYVEMNNVDRDRSVIIDGLTTEDNNKLWSLNKGDISPVILGYEPVSQSVSMGEMYWAVFQVVDKKGTGSSYINWLENAEKSYVQN